MNNMESNLGTPLGTWAHVFIKEYRVLIVRFQSCGLLITLLREQEQMVMLIIAYTSQPRGSNLQFICHKEAQIEQNHQIEKMQEKVNRKTNTRPGAESFRTIIKLEFKIKTSLQCSY
jgi:hypothetical protein